MLSISKKLHERSKNFTNGKTERILLTNRNKTQTLPTS